MLPRTQVQALFVRAAAKIRQCCRESIRGVQHGGDPVAVLLGARQQRCAAVLQALGGCLHLIRLHDADGWATGMPCMRDAQSALNI
jgi:hypothetical protein